MTTKWRAMVVSRNPETWAKFCRILKPWPLEVICCSSAGEARKILAQDAIALVFCEDCLADGGYLDLIEAAKISNLKARVIAVLTMGDSFASNPYLEAMRRGAWDVLSTSSVDSDVAWMVAQAISG